jgi:serine/threonine protein kinase
MSPEQAMGDRELDARSDVYSLGAMLYEMLTGDPPYTGSTAQAIVAKVITEKAPPVTLARDTVPEHVSASIQKALEKLPADRFHSASEFAESLTHAHLAPVPSPATAETATEAAIETVGTTWKSAIPWALTLVFATTAFVLLLGRTADSPQAALGRIAFVVPPSIRRSTGSYSLPMAADSSSVPPSRACTCATWRRQACGRCRGLTRTQVQ